MANDIKHSNNAEKGSERARPTLPDTAAEVRGERAVEDMPRTLADGTMYTMEERLRMIRSEWNTEILPTPPQDPGWHYCWLSTTNTNDPIYRRMQLGYEPVRAIDVPGFAQYRMDQGEFDGCVACNEMLLFRIPQELYQAAMENFHHAKPLEEEELLRSNLPQEVDQRTGRPLVEATKAFDNVVRKASVPIF